MQPVMFRFSGGETTSRPNIDTLLIFSDGSFAECRSEQTAILAARIFISLYLALVYLNPLPELGLALPLHRKKLSDVMAADH